MKSTSIQETKNLAKKFLETITKENQATIIGLRGNLGSGKTTFAKAVAEHLGVGKTVTSPTFVIEKIYKIEKQKFNHLIHIDAYRLQNGKELKTLGWEDISKDSNNLILIEWPENVEDLMPDNTKYIDFEFISENERKIVY